MGSHPLFPSNAGQAHSWLSFCAKSLEKPATIPQAGPLEGPWEISKEGLREDCGTGRDSLNEGAAQSSRELVIKVCPKLEYKHGGMTWKFTWLSQRYRNDQYS